MGLNPLLVLNQKTLIKANRFQKQFLRLVFFLSSFFIVAWGKPSSIGGVGALSALFGFALFFHTCIDYKKREKFLLATLWFACVQAVQLFWMTSLEFQVSGIVVIYLFFALCLGLQFGLFSLFVTRPLGKLQIAACSAIWLLFEWSRLYVGCGFSWNPIGLSLCHFETSLQFASAVGVLGLSFWAIGVNLCLLKGWLKKSLKGILGALFLGCIPYLFGVLHFWYHDSNKAPKKLTVALLQTDWLPCQKLPWLHRLEAFIPPLEQWQEILRAVSVLKRGEIDLVVFPEAALSFSAEKRLYPLPSVQNLFRQASLQGFDPERDFPHLASPYAELTVYPGQTGIFVNHLFIAQTLANYLGSKLVLGLDHTEGGRHFNSAFYLQPKGIQIERYDKRRLLPFAESPPLFYQDWFKRYGLVEFFTPGIQDRIWGDDWLFSPSICYEETFSEPFLQARKKGVEVFINLTNDNYYPNSSLFKDHLFHARVRAVETGAFLFRSCNGGGASIIDSFGRILQGGVSKKTGVITYPCALYSYHSIFSYYGQTGIVVSCFFILGFYLFRRRRDFLEANKGIGLLLFSPKR